jgi:cytochrome c
LQAFAGAAGNEPFLVVAGGEPARSGAVAVLTPGGGVHAVRRVADDVVYAVAIAPDGGSIAAGCADGRVLLLAGKDLRAERVAHRHTAPCRAIAFSPDGALLVSGGLDGTLLLNRRDGAAPRVLQDHTAGVECLAWSADGALLASGARDGKVRVHDRDGRLLRTYLRLCERVTAIAFAAARGTFLAGLLDGKVVALAAGSATFAEVHDFGEPVHALLTQGGVLHVGLTGRVAMLQMR